jgi:diguanylate cyclase (GGDEF)-like protein
VKDVCKERAESGCPGTEECSLLKEIALLRERCLKLEELSFVDALTGLFNFRYMQKALEIEMERTRRTRIPTGLIMADLDHFKKVNDFYGHECGNAALSLVGKVLKESVRIIDVPCRYGGEEFAIILPGASLREAVRIAERLSENIRYSPVVFGKESVTLAASFGVAVFHSSDESTMDEFLRRADELLYEAKNSGRNLIRSEPYSPMQQPDEVTVDEKAELLAAMRGEEP